MGTGMGPCSGHTLRGLAYQGEEVHTAGGWAQQFICGVRTFSIFAEVG